MNVDEGSKYEAVTLDGQLCGGGLMSFLAERQRAERRAGPGANHAAPHPASGRAYTMHTHANTALEVCGRRQMDAMNGVQHFDLLPETSKMVRMAAFQGPGTAMM